MSRRSSSLTEASRLILSQACRTVEWSRPPQLRPDPEEGDVRLLAHQEHRDLARRDDRPVALLAAQLLHPHAVILRHRLGDLLRSDLALLGVVEDVREDRLGQLDRDRHRPHVGVGDDAVQGPLELTDVAHHLASDELHHVRPDRHGRFLGLGPEDGDPRLEVGGREVGDEAPLESAAQPLLERGDLLGRPVRGEDDLLPVLVDGVEGVEELLLGPLLVGDELDVVDEEQVDPPVAGPEVVDAALLDARDELVRELLAGGVDDLLAREAGDDGVADRVHQVCLAQAHPAVEEERVVGVARALGDREGRRVGEPVGRADDEVAEPIPRVQARRAALPADPRRFDADLLRGRLGGRGCRLPRVLANDELHLDAVADDPGQRL